jgi:hypothetical protein
MPRDEEDPDLDDDDDEEPDDEPDPEPERVLAPPPKKKKPSKNLGAIPKFVRTSNEADLVWDQLLQWLPGQHLSAYDVSISVKRIQPPHPDGGPMPMGRSFGGEAVQGGDTETPGSALIQYILQHMHLASGDQRPATYDVYFMRKTNGAGLATGRLNLPEATVAINLLQAADRTQALGAPYRPPPAGGGQGGGYHQPQPPPQHQPPPYYSQPGYGAPPTPHAMTAEFAELGYLRGALNEALAAAREGRQPVIPPPPGVAAPGMSDHDVDRIAAKVALMMGAGARPAEPSPATKPATVAAPPAQPDAGSFEGLIRRSITGLAENVFKAAMGSAEKSIKQNMGLGGLPDDEPDEIPAPAAVVAPEDPANAVPWTVHPVGATWQDGRPMQVALTKDDDRSIDYLHTALFANPILAEKATEVISGAVASLADAAKAFMASRTPGVAGAPPQPQAQVVQRIPLGARDAGGGAGGGGENGAPVPPVAPGGWQAP